MKGHEWQQDSYKGVLHYGQPIRDTNYIEINTDEVRPKDVLYGTLALGSRNSPTKSSEYRLNLATLKSEQTQKGRLLNEMKTSSLRAFKKKDVRPKNVLSTLLGR